jgi:hypothetical protein
MRAHPLPQHRHINASQSADTAPTILPRSGGDLIIVVVIVVPQIGLNVVTATTTAAHLLFQPSERGLVVLHDNPEPGCCEVAD